MWSFWPVTPFLAELGEGRFHSKGKLSLLFWVISIFIFICSWGTIVAVSNIAPNRSNMDYSHESPGCPPPSGPFHLVDYREKDVRAEEAGKGVKGWKTMRKCVLHIQKLLPHISRHGLVELMRVKCIPSSCLLISPPARGPAPFLNGDIQPSSQNLEGLEKAKH